MTQAAFDCASVTAAEGKLVVLTEVATELEVHDSFDDLTSPTILAVLEHGTRLGFGDDHLYSTFDRPAELYSYDMASQSRVILPMEPNTMGVHGIASKGGTITLLDGPPDTQLLVHFYETGLPAGSVPVDNQDVRLHGLSNTCSGEPSVL